MRQGRISAMVLAAVALVVVLAGCNVFAAPPTVKQVGKKPKAVVTIPFCASQPVQPGDPCEDLGNSGRAASGGDFRALIGIRVPVGTDGPRRFTAAVTHPERPDATIAFKENSSYARQLKRKAPRPNGFTYLGYSSRPFPIDEAEDVASRARAKVKLRVPDSLVGKVFKVRPVLGSYHVGGEGHGPQAPIKCGDVFEGRTDDSDYFDERFAICIDAPAEDNFKDLKVRIKEK
jgi:hypothetical protein